MPATPMGSSQKTLLRLAAILMVLLAALALWLAANKAAPNQAGSTLPPPVSLAASGAVKIRVEREGVYAIAEADFRRLGLDPERLESSNLRLSWRGRNLPTWTEKSAAGIEYLFYAATPSSPYSREDIYWLTWGGETPAWLVDENSTAPEESLEILQATHLIPSVNTGEDNVVFYEIVIEEQTNYFPQVESGDRFMWKSMAAPAAEEFTLVLEHLNTAGSLEAELHVELWASTEARIEPDHAMNVLVNGNVAANQTWDGRGRQRFSIKFPASYLKEGENTIRIELPGVPDVAADLVHLDRIVVYYPGMLAKELEQVVFWGSGAVLTLDESDGDVLLLDITEPLSAIALESQPAESGGQQKVETQAGRRYLALRKGEAYAAPQAELPQWTPDLRDPALAVDYIVVGPADLLDPLKALMELRQQQGLTTLMVEDRQVYDQFGYGYPEPDAIQAFLSYAYREWPRAGSDAGLRFVLLVGDATYDPRRYLSSEQANRLPTYLVDTVFGGQTATDVGFVQFNDDPWPDVAVGRLPAQTAQQITDYVDKVLRYEQDLAQNAGSFSVRAVADGQEASFALDAGEFLKLFPESASTDLYSPAAGAEGANQKVRDIFRDGGTIVAYFGHGSVNMWGKDRLFTVEDVAALEAQSQYPIVLNLTCLTGLFTHPKAESLAEALLWKANAGAVAVLAPSSLTLPLDQTFLSHPLARAFSAEQSSTLGEMHLSARRQIPVGTQGSMDVMLTFMLFGDPAIVIK